MGGAGDQREEDEEEGMMGEKRPVDVVLCWKREGYRKGVNATINQNLT